MSGTRKSLGSMLGSAVDPAREPTSVPTPALRSVPPAEQVPKVQGPRWLTYERKDTRLRKDQIQWLAELRKQMNRLRQGRGERLTDNTFIRIALDLLERQQRELQGSTEDELRRSLGLPAEADS